MSGADRFDNPGSGIIFAATGVGSVHGMKLAAAARNLGTVLKCTPR